ncbi:MAG: hypothetical protein U9N73_01170 [Candidatus Auribacterota bacterium]|nr:hypothetical protein [Candidatus Auribacterota bacterium]
MKINRISVTRLPGIEKPFEIDGIKPGINIIFGPNGSGKTSLCRVIRQSLWPRNTVKKTRVLISWDDDNSKLVSRLDGEVTWQRGGEDYDISGLPGLYLKDCYTLQLRDLMEEAGPGDKALADRVRVLMAGGYEISRIDALFDLGKNHGRREEKELRTARAARLRVESESRRLEEEEAELLTLRQALEEAQKANNELIILNVALDRAQKMLEKNGLESELALFPEDMRLLRGDESERIERLTEEIEDIRKIIEDYRRQIEEAEEEIRSNTLPGGAVEPSLLSAQEERSRSLETWSSKLDVSRKNREEAKGRLTAARVALGLRGDKESVPEITEETLNEVHKWVRRAGEVSKRRQEIEASLLALPAREERGEENIERTRRGIDILREWLSCPGAPVGNGARRWAGGVLIVAGAALGYFINPWFAALSGVGLGLIIAASFSPSGNRNLFQDRFEDLGTEGPLSWVRKNVRDALERLEAELRVLEHSMEVEKERERLRGRRKELSGRENEVEEERVRLAEKYGIDPSASELAITDLIDRLKNYREASLEMARAEKTVESERENYEELMARISDFLKENLGEKPEDAIGARNLITVLRDRSAQLNAAMERKTSHTRELKAREKEIKKKMEGISSILKGAGFDPSDSAAIRELSLNISRFEDYRETSSRGEELKKELAELQEKLKGRPDLPDLEVAVAETRIEEAKERGESVARLAGTIQQIEDQIARAEKSDELEKAMDKVRAAESGLTEKYLEARQALAGRLLLEAVLAEYEEEGRPAVFERAGRWFAGFTGDRYELIISTGDEPACFRAIDRELEMGMGLGELSDGTRVQLLLAARMAFATYRDGGKKLPIFLDEALTTSDPARFRAITRSLLVLAREGHQIFYLTANPSDVAFMEKICREEGDSEPYTIDLGQIRKIAAGAKRDELSLPEMGMIPAPGRMSPEEYGEILKVPVFDPLAPSGSCHLFHPLYDDLKLLYSIIRYVGVETVGQWKLFLRRNPEPPGLSPAETARVNDLVNIIELFHSAYMIGRGKPVDRDVLEESGAVSKKYLSPFTEMVEEVSGDGVKFMELLESGEDSRLSRFSSKKKEELGNFLEENEFIDLRQRLSKEEITAEITVRAEIFSNISAEDIAFRVSGLWTRARAYS